MHQLRSGKPSLPTHLFRLQCFSMRCADCLLSTDEDILSILQFSSTVSSASAKPASQAVLVTSEASQPQRTCSVKLPTVTQTGSLQNDGGYQPPRAEAFRAPRRAFAPPRIQHSGPDGPEVKRLKADVRAPAPRVLPSSFKASAERHAASDRWGKAVPRPGSAPAEKENAAQAAPQAPTAACTLELHFTDKSHAERRVRVPDRFEGGASEYVRVWKAAVQEEMNLRCSNVSDNHI